MDTNPKRETVVGIFKDRKAAAAALDNLVEAQFDIESDAGVIISHRDSSESVPIMSDVPVGRGALIGSGVGFLLGATIAWAAGLDFGWFSMTPWGPVWAAFESGYVGAAMGVAVGVMMSFEFARPEAAFHATRAPGGIVWVGVRAAGARAERAREILTAAGAKPPSEHSPERVAA